MKFTGIMIHSLRMYLTLFDLMLMLMCDHLYYYNNKGCGPVFKGHGFTTTRCNSNLSYASNFKTFCCKGEVHTIPATYKIGCFHLPLHHVLGFKFRLLVATTTFITFLRLLVVCWLGIVMQQSGLVQFLIKFSEL